VLVLYLALQGGGYDVVVRSETGIAVWWIVLLGALIGVLPVRGLSRPAWVALGLLAGFGLWTAAAVSWSESEERTVIEAARVATYLGVLALALSAQGREGLRRVVYSIGFALAVVGALALLSRLHPAWFPSNEAGAAFDLRSRLNYPVNYWNGLAAMMAIGVPLVLAIALDARRIAVKALATAAVPVMALTAFYTLSRGGAVEVAAGFAMFLMLYPRRLTALPTLILAVGGSALLITAATQRHALEDGLTTSAALDQGDSMLTFTLVVCVGVALVRGALALAERHELVPHVRVSRRASITALCTALFAGAVVAIAAGTPGTVSDAWDEFKQPAVPEQNTTVERFQSASGNGRYQYWQAAIEAGETDPLKGIGPGTYEYFWAREGSIPGFVRDAHSLFLETFAELGIPGLVLILALVLGIVGFAIWRSLNATLAARPWFAAAAAAATAFAVAAAIDWAWELSVIPVCFLLLAAAVVGAERAPSPPRGRMRARVALIVASCIALAGIAIPLAGTSSIRASQSAASGNDLNQALEHARSGTDIEPWAASPNLQEALVLELRGDLSAAASAARAATRDEPTNWRNWLVLSRIEAFRGNSRQAVDAYRHARSLNPRSPLFPR
jgi:tetratricopeptide (TPR) repeat protein